MGARGTKPRPTALKVLQGERKSRINAHEPVLEAREVVPPPLVEGHALELWEEYAPELVRVGILHAAQAEAFAGWCIETARYAHARRMIEADGGEVREVPVIDRNRQLVGSRQVRNEWSRVADSALAASLRLAVQFGLTPSSLSTLRAPDVSSATPKGEDILTG
jgi:phage terminase small subunit